MQINTLRKELTRLLSERPLSRMPSVRRSRSEEWLYASDFPGLCTAEEQEKIADRLREYGWETAVTEGWALLRKPAEEPPEGWYSDGFGPEAACCLSLLDRHAERGNSAEAAQRMLIKAGEEGGKAYETACAALHREWAERLRKREPLPAVSRRYFTK
jgi:hypothetical protein